MTEAQKDTIYIDVDDEITGIIEKVKDSPHKIVALVLPKRATVLQSIVNMKLLNRSAKTAKKSLVLITSEAGLLPLAGAVGVHVAKNLQSKPAIPAGPATDEIPESLINEEEIDADEDDPEIDDSKPIGDLAGVADEEETIDLNDDEPATADKKADKPAKDKKLKVPNFERFRKWLIIGGIALLVLIVGGYFAMVRMPKANIVITTDSTDTTTNVAFTANTSTKTYDEAAKVIPAEMPSVKKTDSQSAPATGQKNNGTKATGTVTITAQKCGIISVNPPASIAAGTGVSSGGQTYITQKTTVFTTLEPKDSCINYKSTPTDITAQNGGVAYNVSGATFTVSGRSDISSATGSANGGTDNMVKVVSQADVDAAKAKLTTQAQSDAAKTELTNTLKKDGMFIITSSLAVDGPTITTAPNVGDPADNVTVTSTATYTLLGVNQDDLNKLITAQAKGQIDQGKQTVQDTGLSTATFTVQGKDNPQVVATTTVTIGPNLDTNAIKKEIAGKKKAETTDIIQSRPSIKSVTVNYSPFWVNKTPKNANKVTITFNKAGK
ncbi:MAG: hypothetical protein WCJ24_00185 [Candidatus Saccharibacteria bacterium]